MFKASLLVDLKSVSEELYVFATDLKSQIEKVEALLEF